MKSLVVLIALTGCGSVGSTSTADDPSITSIEPTRGPKSGGIAITVRGTNFVEGDAIALVGERQATDVSVVSDTELTFTLPPGDEGQIAEVTVGTSRGFASLPAAFTYNLQPIVLAVTPAMVSREGGAVITVTGRGFVADAGLPIVRVAGVAATEVTVVDDRTLTARVAPLPATEPPFSRVDVEVETANGRTLLADPLTLTTRGLIGIQSSRFQSQSSVFFIDPSDGAVTSIAQGFPRNIMTCATRGPTIYATGLRAQVEDELFTFDPLAGTSTTIGLLRDNANMPHGASSLTFAGETLVGLDGASRGAQTLRLMTIDTATARVTVRGAAPMAITKPASIATRDGSSVFLVDRTNEPLETILVADSSAKAGPVLVSPNPSNVHALTMLDGALYLYERSGSSRLLRVDPMTGVATPFGPSPFGFRALCTTPDGW